MEENRGQDHIFTCNLCFKTFSKKESRARHISYCRKKKARIRSRQKACLDCVRAKTYCDLASPNCSRCSIKNLACVYKRVQLPKTPTNVPNNTVDTIVDPASPLDLATQIPYPLTETRIVQPADVVTFDNLDYENWQFSPTSFSYPYMEDMGTVIASRHPHRFPQPPLSRTGPAIESPLHQLFPAPLKLFLPRKVARDRFSLNRSYILATLRSYPYMLLRGESLPPFIHPQCYSHITSDSMANEKSFPNPLSNCAAILQMFSIKNKNNTLFIWNTIKLEQERLYNECALFDDLDKVAALQAITIYILLRLSEDNEEATTFDVPLVQTMIKLSVQVLGLTKKFTMPTDSGVPSWKGWALAESLCRTIFVLFLVDILVDIASALPSYNCDGSVLGSMALPCTRGPWRANNIVKWKKEFTAGSNETGIGMHLIFSDLLKFQSSTNRRLDFWLSQVDDFGTLLIAAAAL